MGDVYYFSNGTEGDIWMNANCNRCRHDHSMHSAEQDVDNACRHVLAMVIGEADPVFIRTPHPNPAYDFDVLECTEFTRCPCNRGPDDPGVPLPPPIDPNQGALFHADALMPGVWRDVVLDELAPAEAQ